MTVFFFVLHTIGRLCGDGVVVCDQPKKKPRTPYTELRENHERARASLSLCVVSRSSAIPNRVLFFYRFITHTPHANDLSPRGDIEVRLRKGPASHPIVFAHFLPRTHTPHTVEFLTRVQSRKHCKKKIPPHPRTLAYSTR